MEAFAVKVLPVRATRASSLHGAVAADNDPMQLMSDSDLELISAAYSHSCSRTRRRLLPDSESSGCSFRCVSAMGAVTGEVERCLAAW